MTAALRNAHEINPAIRRDLENALRQQMFFWGMDVSFRSGNLFLERGFVRSPSPGLQGTSCYSLPWRDGSVELHGGCAGWYAAGGGSGVIYIRSAEKCFRWHGSAIPVPGNWEAGSLSPLDLGESMGSVIPFLEWWLDFEKFVRDRADNAYRRRCFKKYKSLPKSKPWLKPDAGLAWLESLRANPATTSRAKRFSHSAVS